MKQDTLEGRAKTKNGVIRLCFSVLCILLEAAFIIIVITRLNEYAEIVNLLTRVFAGILVLALYASDQTSSMKMPWIILILVFPIMGVALYLLIGLNGGTRKMRERYADIDRKLLPLLPDNREKLENIKNKIPKAGNISEYIWKNAGYPVYQNTDIVYYDEAVKGLEAQLSALSKAGGSFKGAALYFYGIPCDRRCRGLEKDPESAGGACAGRRGGASIL